MTLLVSDIKITVKPNNSLSVKNSIRLVAGLAAMSMLVGVGFALAGAWMVLPFAGLEVIAIAYAFFYMYQRSHDVETITIEDDRVIVEKRGYDAVSRDEFHRYWARVILRKQANGRGALFIGSHGKEVEFGRHFINDEQRILLARQIKQKLNKVNETF